MMKSPYTSGLVDDPANRQIHDFYPTFPPATRALLAHERFSEFVWEPACGAGDISKVLKEAGHKVSSTDLNDYGYGQSSVDFLAQDKALGTDIITNPPFKLAQEFIEHAISLVRPNRGKVAMFLRLAFLAGVGRGGKPGRKHLFETTPLTKIYILSRRPPMQRGRLHEKGDSTGVVDFAWFIWDTDANYFNDTIVKWVDWREHEQ